MLRLRDLAFLDEQTHASFPASEIRSGDVLLNITGASIGRSAVATDALDGGNVNQHVCEIRLDKRQMNPMFVCQILLSRLGQRQIASSQAGGNRQGLNFRQVGSITVPEPRLGEQRAMAAALSDADALIATLERLIGKKEAIKQGMMQQLFAGETRLAGFSGLWRSMDFEALASPVKQRTDPQLVPANTPLIELRTDGLGQRAVARTGDSEGSHLSQDGLPARRRALREAPCVPTQVLACQHSGHLFDRDLGSPANPGSYGLIY